MKKAHECPRCLFTSEIAAFQKKDGQCEYCDIHDSLEAQSPPKKLEPMLNRIRKIKGKYNCLVGISGGLDSTTMLWLAVKYWGLRPLVIHFDNGWNTEEAEYNMKAIVEKLGVDLIRYSVNKEEYDTLNDAFLCAGVPDADIPNDIAMTKLMYDTAHKYGIKYILNGHDFREEGSTPRDWTYMDAEYIRSVYKWHTKGAVLVNYPLFTFKDQLLGAIRGIKQVRPFYYLSDRQKYEAEMMKQTGFNWYGGKHKENIYTDYVGSELLPHKFKIDKRIVYLSAQVRSNMMSKERALHELEGGETFKMEKLGERAAMIDWLAGSDIRDRREFGRYDFKKWRVWIWILAKMKVVPWTFYIKYAK